MKMFSECSGKCKDCTTYITGGCLAGHDDDYFNPITKVWIEKRLEQIEFEKTKILDWLKQRIYLNLKYYAKIEKDGNYKYIVSFPDFENIHTFGENLEEALEYAEGALNGCIECDIARGFELPIPSIFKNKINYYLIDIEVYSEKLTKKELRNLIIKHTKSF